MNVRNFNWPIWAGFLLSLFAFLSYPLLFVWFPVTRDFPWANIILFALSGVLLYIGARRAFAPDRPHPMRSKIIGGVVSLLAITVFGLFIFIAFIYASDLPASKGAPQVGQKAPDFTLPDTNGKPISLAELQSTPINGKAPKGVLLIFYRGYW